DGLFDHDDHRLGNRRRPELILRSRASPPGCFHIPAACKSIRPPTMTRKIAKTIFRSRPSSLWASVTPSGAVSAARPPIRISEGILMNPTLSGGVPTADHPEMTNPMTAGTARITPSAELVPTAV